jgi:hypothetical protein
MNQAIPEGSCDMNTPIESNAENTHPPVDEKRRRLAKGGLAAPIVLGTLLSRPVLGAAPYNCTISGQMSGNVSSHNGEITSCRSLGVSPGYWMNHESWPFPYVYGAPAAGQCPVDASSTGTATPGTRFNQAAALGSTFLDVFRCVAITETKTQTTYTNGTCSEKYRYGPKKGQCKTYNQVPSTTTSTVQTGCEVVSPSDPRFSTGVPATLLQVLQTGGGLNDTAIAALGRAAVASLLNAANTAPDYPLTCKQVIDIFNAVCNGGVYPINDSVSWNADQVKKYFESLYG